jgi:death-on-curing protein
MQITQYLTVQDLIWINSTLTGKDQAFDFAKLEEATYYQYGYGKSVDLLGQAGRFLPGFAKQKPFAKANKATAFVATLAFLSMNGFHIELDDDDGAKWCRRALGEENCREDLSSITSVSSGHDHSPDVRAIVYDLVARYSDSIGSLSSQRAART